MSKFFSLIWLFTSILFALAARGKESTQQRSNIAKIAAAGVLAVSAIYYTVSSSTSFYNNAYSIPDEIIRSKKELTVKVVSITDGDTYRVRHLPSIFSSSKYNGNLKDNTIAVRIAAVDTPEVAKFGKPGQVCITACVCLHIYTHYSMHIYNSVTHKHTKLI